MSANIVVKADLIKDSGLVFDKGVMTVRRVYAVTGLDNTTTDQYGVALTAQGIPTYGQAHPSIGGCVAQTFEIEPLRNGNGLSATAMQVTVTYVSLLVSQIPFAIEFSSELMQVTTDIDKTGNEIFVTWSARKESVQVSLSGATDTKLVPQRGEVPKYVRCDKIRYTCWLINTNNTLEFPTPIELLKGKYLGKVNVTPFRGGNRHDWMVTICDGTTEDFGKSYTIVIEVVKRPVPKLAKPLQSGKVPGGWDEWAWYTVEDGGIAYGVNRIKEDGVKLIDNLYDEVELGDLPQDLTTLKNNTSTSL